MSDIRATECCGIDEIYNLDAPLETITDVCENRLSGDICAIYLFHDAVRYKNGTKLAKYILDNDLGTVVETKSVRNPNSGRMVKAWLWTPKMRTLKAWYKKNKDADQ